MASPEYLSMLGSDESWEDYLGALVQFHKTMAQLPGNEDVLIDVTVEIARVQHEGMGRPDAAQAVLEQAVSAMGNSPKLRFELAKRTAAAGNLSKAADELRRLISEDPLRPDPWALLVQIYRAEGKEAEAETAEAPLAVIAKGVHGRLHVQPRFSGAGAVAPGALNGQRLLEVMPRTPGIDALGALLSLLTDALTKVYAPNLEQFGLSLRDKLAETHPLRLLTKLMAKAFSVEAHDLYISNKAAEIAVELTDPISIVVPVSLNEADQAIRIFALSRVFSYIARGQETILRMGHAEARLTLAALCYKYASAFGAGFDGESLERQSKRIYKAVSWRAKKAVEEASAAFAMTRGTDPLRCLSAIEAASVRISAVVAGDLGAVAKYLSAELRDKGAVSAVMTDLLSFWVSDTAFSFRRNTKLM
jgi:tetratricopeptide (TPR) repeat protein